MPTSNKDQKLENFLLRVMQVERRYAHRLTGVRNERRQRLREVLEEHEFSGRTSGNKEMS